MSGNENRLHIHAQITPDSTPKETERKPVRWKSIPHPKQLQPLSFPDRLLRSSAIACALLLGVLALGNINQPWARSASESIERALTMQIDLDDSIGRLSFVKKLMPESALVFLNLSGENLMQRPVDGKIIHEYSDTQPWLLFECTAGEDVLAPEAGIVTAVSPLSGNTFGIMIDHGNGLESICAYLEEVCIESGSTVQRGQKIGTAGINLYFELRQSENSMNPSTYMGL